MAAESTAAILLAVNPSVWISGLKSRKSRKSRKSGEIRPESKNAFLQMMTEGELRRMKQLLYTWRDIFHSDPETMPVTDLVIHTIPTYSNMRPYKSKEKLYTPKEVQWQRENIAKLLKAGVISYCDSPWSARTKHPVKKDGSLHMVNIFCPINDATIKSNYPMKRIEPIVNLLS